MLNSWKDHYWAGVPVMRKRIEETVRMAEARGKTVLEIGCNDGVLSKALMEDGAMVTPADICEEHIKNAIENFGIAVVRADITALPFSNRSFDIAVSGETLEHVAYPFKALNELFRVARERVVISLPVGEYWLGELTHQWEINGEFIDHDSAFVRKAERDILILRFDRRRDDNFVDIAPFDTKTLKEKYSIR